LRAAPSLWSAGLFALLACSLPVPFAEQWLFTTGRPQLAEASDCQRCHGAIYEEWLDSPHAGAWTRDGFVASTGDYAADACLACHAPGPLGQRGEPELRSDHREEGVTCTTCHLSADPHAAPLTMRGPHERTSPVDVHPVVQDELFLSAELCGSCHERAFVEWEASPEPDDGEPKRVCQDCHMPAVRRRMESYNPEKPYSAALVVLGRAVDGRRHGFGVPDDPWEDIELRVEPGSVGRPARVHVANRLPHGVPTGGYGQRVARLQVRWPGGEVRQEIRAALEQAIGAGETRVFEFPQIPPGVPTTAVLERRNPRTGAFERLAPAPEVVRP